MLVIDQGRGQQERISILTTSYYAEWIFFLSGLTATGEHHPGASIGKVSLWLSVSVSKVFFFSLTFDVFNARTLNLLKGNALGRGCCTLQHGSRVDPFDRGPGLGAHIQGSLIS